MKSVLATTLALMTTAAQGIVIWYVSTEPGNAGVRQTWASERWICDRQGHDITEQYLDNNISYAYVDRTGLGNGCTLFEDVGCKGESVSIKKSEVLGPGQVNLTDVNFDNRASSWSCY
ncbi:hypothetical protein CC80DRAFT_415516 [Byssothecium circinans]|uniref:Uncharacterized protein n=1 Tax=Byssothecium circinans TaxID=147558 RepID=A0A6A5TR06_9PLEO|nr:hypothetical protein CC80DRAFT_415516 [Byssothecium circinans]